MSKSLVDLCKGDGLYIYCYDTDSEEELIDQLYEVESVDKEKGYVNYSLCYSTTIGGTDKEYNKEKNLISIKLKDNTDWNIIIPKIDTDYLESVEIDDDTYFQEYVIISTNKEKFYNALDHHKINEVKNQKRIRDIIYNSKFCWKFLL